MSFALLNIVPPGWHQPGHLRLNRRSHTNGIGVTRLGAQQLESLGLAVQP